MGGPSKYVDIIPDTKASNGLFFLTVPSITGRFSQIIDVIVKARKETTLSLTNWDSGARYNILLHCRRKTDVHANLEKEFNRLLVWDVCNRCRNEPSCSCVASLY